MRNEDAIRLKTLIGKFGDMSKGQLIKHLMSSTGEGVDERLRELKQMSRGELLSCVLWNATRGFRSISDFPVRHY